MSIHELRKELAALKSGEPISITHLEIKYGISIGDLIRLAVCPDY